MNLPVFIIDIVMRNLGQTLRKKRGMVFLWLSILGPLMISPVFAASAGSSSRMSDSARRRIGAGEQVLPEETGGEIQSFAGDDQSFIGDAARSSAGGGDRSSEALDLLRERLSERTRPQPSQSVLPGPSMLKAAFSLALVLAGIFGMSYLVKKYYLKGNLLGGKYIHLLETCSLGPKNSLVLVQVENQTLLLGVGGQQIVVLTQLNSLGKSKTEETGGVKTRPKAAESFAEQLSINALKMQHLPQESGSASSIAGILESRLKGLKKV
ncbi:MAG: flagellar biosynthetic protein FliO [bacterium]